MVLAVVAAREDWLASAGSTDLQIGDLCSQASCSGFTGGQTNTCALLICEC